MRSFDKVDRSSVFRLRSGRIFALVILLPLISAYGGSYAYLSRRGMREAETVNWKFFLYVPMEEVGATHDLSEHHRRMAFYAPANWVDRTFFGGKHPIVCILWGLSKETAQPPTSLP